MGWYGVWPASLLMSWSKPMHPSISIYTLGLGETYQELLRDKRQELFTYSYTSDAPRLRNSPSHHLPPLCLSPLLALLAAIFPFLLFFNPTHNSVANN
jgi:hypothetical protein